MIDLIRQARRVSPSFLDLVPLLLFLDPDYRPPRTEDFDTDKPPVEMLLWLYLSPRRKLETDAIYAFGGALAVFLANMDAIGMPIVWSHPSFRDGSWAVHKIMSSSPSTPAVGVALMLDKPSKI